MKNLIEEKLNKEKIVGIIPIESKRLKIKTDNISMAPSIEAYLIMFLICLLPAMFLFGFFTFILLDFGASIYSIIIFCVMILSGLMYLADKIYVNYIKKYPDSALVLTKSNLYYFLMKNNKILKYNKLDVDIKNLGQFFYGDMDRNTGKIGKRFLIKRNGTTLVSGNLKIENNKFQCDYFSGEDLLPFEELHKIYIS